MNQWNDSLWTELRWLLSQVRSGQCRVDKKWSHQRYTMVGGGVTWQSGLTWSCHQVTTLTQAVTQLASWQAHISCLVINSQCRVEVVRHQAWPQPGRSLPDEKGIYHCTVIRQGYYCWCSPPLLSPSLFSPCSAHLIPNLLLFVWVSPHYIVPPSSILLSLLLPSSFISYSQVLTPPLLPASLPISSSSASSSPPSSSAHMQYYP